MSKIHYFDDRIGHGVIACGAYSDRWNVLGSTNDKALVTCGACKRTRVYRGLPEKLAQWQVVAMNRAASLSDDDLVDALVDEAIDEYYGAPDYYANELKKRLRG